MKKVCAMVLALVMSLSLIACGGVNKQPAIDAFNAASTQFDALAVLINETPDLQQEDLIDAMIEMADVMSQHKELLESDTELTETDMADMIAWYGQVEDWVAAVKTEYGIE